ncbi:trigger factor [Latilactobacillus fuchuensis]|uniref:Trigger factor n=2 Tax=Latilactobacillus fuchuensis TaxID=164393 RepID=A0A2N9DVP6_9LACO|nr:trigger factor [Latilactobacillus fuchuensis]KRL58449.1 trigger factor [Latilactobacillus fuchuensis DSM 14340 = JCM 11249]MCP8857687.1 trigger factor [Latilactobacillus fuchuensis]SPC38592.1 prolyl isomerase (trigger factor) [Latilactobacillus fuchuensis]
MSAKWEKKGTNDGVLTFEIDLDKISEGLDVAFKRVRKNINTPGFRKGKMPRQIFNKMYGEEALYEDALNAVLPEAYDAAVKEAAIQPVDQPEINVEKMEKGAAWVISAKVIVKPEVKLGDYKGLEVPKQSRRITIKDVEQELETRRERQAELVLKEDAAAENGDTVVIDYEGSVDGELFDGGKADNYSLELGSNSFIPGFEDQLVGHKAGEEVEVKVTFPKDYQAEELADKEAIFKVTMHEVKAKELPELDDEFAKDVDEDVDSLDELKEKIREELKQQKNDAADTAIQDAAVAAATENATIEDLPQAMLDEEVNTQLQQYLGNMQQQGIQPEMYYQITGTTEDDLKKQFEGDADKHVKTNLVLEAIVAAEKIEATDEEVAAEIKELATQYKMEESAVRGVLSDDMLKHDIGVKKVIDMITDSAVEVKDAK